MTVGNGGWGEEVLSWPTGPLPIFPTLCLSLPSVPFSNVCPLKGLPVLICPIYPLVSLLIPQLRSQGSHFVHPLIADPGSFVMPGLLTGSASGTGQRVACGPRTKAKGS